MDRNEDYIFRRECMIPLLSKEGSREAAGVVCSKSRSIHLDAREALLH
jgi:hypothetical protein